jgi:hypothetical protein
VALDRSSLLSYSDTLTVVKRSDVTYGSCLIVLCNAELVPCNKEKLSLHAFCGFSVVCMLYQDMDDGHLFYQVGEFIIDFVTLLQKWSCAWFDSSGYARISQKRALLVQSCLFSTPMAALLLFCCIKMCGGQFFHEVGELIIDFVSLRRSGAMQVITVLGI